MYAWGTIGWCIVKTAKMKGVFTTNCDNFC